MKKIILILGIVLIVVIFLFGLIAFNNNQKQSNKETKLLLNTENEIQTAILSYNDSGYILTPNILKEGIPVKITVDTSSVNGCLRDVVIGDFGIKKYITAQDNIIEFTPNKDGQFLIACSMNMGRGFFSVN